MTAHKQNPIQYSSQEIDNESYNDAYKIRETALYAYNSDTDSFVPLTADTSGGLKAAEKYSLKPYAQVLTANDTITPSSGKRIQLVWAQVIANPDNSTNNLVTIQMTIGSVLTTIYSVYALGRSAVFTGDVNQPVLINVANAQPVSVNIQYKEI